MLAALVGASRCATVSPRSAPRSIAVAEVPASPVLEGNAIPVAGGSSAPAVSLERNFFRNLLGDQKAIWTSPFRLQGRDLQWLVPAAGATAALIATDRKNAGQDGDEPSQVAWSRGISEAGAAYSTFGLAGGLYLAGRWGRNDRLRETGLLGFEALVNASVVGGMLKVATRRQRPDAEDREGAFFEGGSSFPSGHSMAAWSLAAVVANEYPDRKIVPIAAYALASLISVSRFTGGNHFASDVVVGSAFGYLIGRYVYRAHHAGSSEEGGHSAAWLRPAVAPWCDPGSRGCGFSLLWRPSLR